MKISFALFAISGLLVLGLTTFTGLMVEAHIGYTRHVLLGVLAAFFACFVHVVLFMYFVVQDKIIAQSILHHKLDAGFSLRIRRMKSRAMKLSMGGIVTILITSGLGASIDAGLPVSAHQIAAFATLVIEALIFYLQFALLDEYQALFAEAFGEE